MSHFPFSCPCGKTFLEETSLIRHREDKERNERSWKCPVCCRSFHTTKGQYQHQTAKEHWVHCDERCGRVFSTVAALNQHLNHHRTRSGTHYVCHSCTKTFCKQTILDQHQRNAGHCNDKNNPAKAYVNGFMKERKVALDPDEKRKSVAYVKNLLDEVIRVVREQPGGKVYSSAIRKAGSHAAGTKIGKPNEFDTNIPMHVDIIDIMKRGSLPYIYEDKVIETQTGPSLKNLNISRTLVDNKTGKIPIGKVRVIVNEDSTPSNLVHNGDLIAHKVNEDFYNRLNAALKELDLTDVSLSKCAHGPALTMTIKRDNEHDISIDLTTSLPCNEPVTADGWPRPATIRALPADVIEHVKYSGMHLVPKGDEVWTLSYSKAETALFSKIDKDNGCLKDVMKYCKRLKEICASGPGEGLPGVSSHIIKNATLWCHEEHACEGYWHKRNMDKCLIDTLNYTEKVLRAGKLPNYFNIKENILKEKDQDVLNTLSNSFKEERLKLIHL